MSAPNYIDLVYRKVDGDHIFASKGIKGLVHIADTSLPEAYDRLLEALSFHVLHTYSAEARYDCEAGFAGLEQQAERGGGLAFVTAHLHTPVAC